MSDLFYLPLSQKRVNMKGLGMINLCGRETSTMTEYQGYEAFPGNPPEGSGIKVGSQQNILCS